MKIEKHICGGLEKILSQPMSQTWSGHKQNTEVFLTYRNDNKIVRTVGYVVYLDREA